MQISRWWYFRKLPNHVPLSIFEVFDQPWEPGFLVFSGNMRSWHASLRPGASFRPRTSHSRPYLISKNWEPFYPTFYSPSAIHFQSDKNVSNWKKWKIWRMSRWQKNLLVKKEIGILKFCLFMKDLPLRNTKNTKSDCKRLEMDSFDFSYLC